MMADSQPCLLQSLVMSIPVSQTHSCQVHILLFNKRKSLPKEFTTLEGFYRDHDNPFWLAVLLVFMSTVYLLTYDFLSTDIYQSEHMLIDHDNLFWLALLLAPVVGSGDYR